MKFSTIFTSGTFDEVGFHIHVDIFLFRFEDKLPITKIRFCLAQPVQDLPKIFISDDTLTRQHDPMDLTTPDVIWDQARIDINRLCEVFGFS